MDVLANSTDYKLLLLCVISYASTLDVHAFVTSPVWFQLFRGWNFEKISDLMNLIWFSSLHRLQRVMWWIGVSVLEVVLDVNVMDVMAVLVMAVHSVMLKCSAVMVRYKWSNHAQWEHKMQGIVVNAVSRGENVRSRMFSALCSRVEGLNRICQYLIQLRGLFIIFLSRNFRDTSVKSLMNSESIFPSIQSITWRVSLKFFFSNRFSSSRWRWKCYYMPARKFFNNNEFLFCFFFILLLHTCTLVVCISKIRLKVNCFRIRHQIMTTIKSSSFHYTMYIRSYNTNLYLNCDLLLLLSRI